MTFRFRSIPAFLIIYLIACVFAVSVVLAKETDRDAGAKTRSVKAEKEQPRRSTPANTAQALSPKQKPSTTQDKPHQQSTVTPVATTVTPATPPAPVTPNQPVSKPAGEQIKWQVIASGGAINGTSTSYRMSGTIGQTAVGLGYSANFKINQGFQQNFSSGGASSCCGGETGDVNADGQENLSDLTQLVNYLFVSFVPVACSQEANTSGDAACSVNLSDLSALANKLFVTFTPTAQCGDFDIERCR